MSQNLRSLLPLHLVTQCHTLSIPSPLDVWRNLWMAPNYRESLIFQSVCNVSPKISRRRSQNSKRCTSIKIMYRKVSYIEELDKHILRKRLVITFWKPRKIMWTVENITSFSMLKQVLTSIYHVLPRREPLLYSETHFLQRNHVGKHGVANNISSHQSSSLVLKVKPLPISFLTNTILETRGTTFLVIL